ncbi:hypothetical protein MMC31_002549, partial [Peltigera leucophlebia]|nr:hypothetical protein [Peltigera leucophlebia]
IPFRQERAHLTACYHFDNGQQSTAHIRVRPWRKTQEPEFFNSVTATKVIGDL